MELDQFVEEFADQFDDLDVFEITASTEFHKLDKWCPRFYLVIVFMVMRVYGKRITVADIDNSVTVEDLFNIVSNK